MPLLVEHLRLPDTDLEAVGQIADAALALEAKESLEPFQDFLLQYRADPAFAGASRPADRRLQRPAEAGRAQAALPAAVRGRGTPRRIEPVADHLQRSLAARTRTPAPAKPASRRPMNSRRCEGCSSLALG